MIEVNSLTITAGQRGQLITGYVERGVKPNLRFDFDTRRDRLSFLAWGVPGGWRPTEPPDPVVEAVRAAVAAETARLGREET